MRPKKKGACSQAGGHETLLDLYFLYQQGQMVCFLPFFIYFFLTLTLKTITSLSGNEPH